MKFAYGAGSLYEMLVLGGAALLLLLYITTVAAAARKRRASIAALGDPKHVDRLTTHALGNARTAKHVIVALSFVLATFALMRPQYGRGTRLIPATNLDVVIVLDYSKSMYARDVVPSRIMRAKAEVADLIKALPGARFGAVAFAGEPMAFPLTSDGAAIAQFFRQLDPNDMPVGGTATARALERARELLNRDPKSKSHVRVIVLVTDGEDLEGDPVQVAEAAAAEQTRIDVVQVGGRAPEVIPEVDQNGTVLGPRRDELGKPIMTELTEQGEAQLAQIAEKTHGSIVIAKKGETGIDKIAAGLVKMMREELSERVETLFDDVYRVPLAVALLLLVLEMLLVEAPQRTRKTWDQIRGAAGGAE